MGWTDSAVKDLESLQKGNTYAHYVQSGLDKLHKAGAILEAVRETQFYQDLKPVEKLTELYTTGKEALKESGLTKYGKGLDAAGKIISIADTVIDYGKGAIKVAHGDVEGGTQDITRGVAKIALAATGPGALVDYPFTKALQAYAAHDLGRPLTAQEKKDITFTNMAGDGLNAVLKPVGDAMGQGAYDGVQWTKKTAGELEKKAGELEHKAVDKAKEVVHEGADALHKAEHKVTQVAHDAKDVAVHTGQAVAHKATEIAHDEKDKATEVAHEVKDKTTEIAHEVKNKATEVAHEVKDKTTEIAHEVKDKTTEIAHDVKDKATEVAQDVKQGVVDLANKAVAPEVQQQAKADFAQAMAQPGVLNKLEGLGNAGHNLLKGIGIGQ